MIPFKLGMKRLTLDCTGRNGKVNASTASLTLCRLQRLDVLEIKDADVSNSMYLISTYNLPN